MLEQFLEDFYDTISFEFGEQMKANQLRSFFLENAVLIERKEDSYKQKTINEHIEEFNTAIQVYPQLFINGFQEKQLDFSVMENDTCILVSSHYLKKYTKEERPYEEKGNNNMILVKQGNELKIASILW